MIFKDILKSTSKGKFKVKKLNSVPILLLIGTFSIPSMMQADDIDISANVGVMSNYIYRGMTQTGDRASVNAGVNAFYNGFYAGATVLTVDFGTDDNLEIDYFAGYTNSLGIFTYDMNVFITSYDGSTNHFTEVALGVSWPCQVVDDLTLGITYSKGINNAPDNFNIKAGYDLSVVTIEADYNNYDTIGKAKTIGISKSFQVSNYTINTVLRYTDFSSNNFYIEDQNNLYLTAKLTF